MQVFYSYSHSPQDEALRGELETQLAVVKRNELITDWHDGEIAAGKDWDAEIKKKLNAADIILLLVSANFLASDYIWQVELTQAIKRHEAGEARVIPVILRLCDWQNSILGKLKALPKDGKPITKWEDRDEAFLDVVNGIRKVLETPILPKPSSFSSTLITHPPKVKNWVGREDAIAQIQDWIAHPSVTLIGIQGLGGVGKSALAAYIYNQFCGGEMPPTSSPIHKFQWADVSQKPDFVAFAEGIFSGLGGKIIQAGDINLVVNQLINFLNQQPCLLVVDNLETLLTETEGWQDSGYEKFFSRWIEKGQASTLLLTTREKPNLFQGWEYWHSLEGLKPKKGAQLLQELKIKGTEAALETFAQSLDGHPLTLRLVAGFLREYCGGELSRVDELGLAQEELIFKEAEGLHREKTDARISWILDQHLQRLTPQEQRFLLNLTVYRQPFDSEAAVWMWEDLTPLTPLPCEGRGEPLPNDNLLLSPSFRRGLGGGPEGLGERSTVKPFRIRKELATLRNRSLLLEIGGNRFQFQFLIQRYLQQILVRQYSQQQGTDLSFAHQQALKYYLSHLKPEPWDSLDDVSEYLEACYHHCQLQQYAQAYEIVERCHTFLDLRGDYQRLVEVYGTLTREWQPKRLEERANLGKLWTRLGLAYYWLKKYGEDIKCQQKANEIFSEIEDSNGQAWSLCYLGNAYNSKNNYEDAVKFHKQALKIVKKIHNKEEKDKIVATILGSFAFIYNSKQKYKKVISFAQKSLNLKKEINDLRGEMYSLGDLGGAYYCLSDYEKAIECYKEQLEIACKIVDTHGKPVGDTHGKAAALGGLGDSYYAMGKYNDAIFSYKEELTHINQLGDQDWQAGTLRRLGKAFDYWGDSQQAIEFHQQALETAKKCGNRYVEADSLGGLGYAYSKLKDYEQAIEFHQQSLTITKEIGRRDVEADAYCGLGDVYRSLEQYTEARDYYQQSLDIAKEINYRRGEADASFYLGLVLAKLNCPFEAVTALQNARQLYQEMGLDAKVQECDSEIEKIGQF